MKVYVDMDGTLVDFVSQVNKYDFWQSGKNNKVDWKKVKAMGPKFWSEMDWMPDAENTFNDFIDWENKGFIELYILSSIDFEDGIEGKKQWITQHTEFPLEKVIFVTEPEDKAQYAASDAWLIDDRKKSLDPFKESGGNIIEFNNKWISINIELRNIVSTNIISKKSLNHQKIKTPNVLFEYRSSPAFVCSTDENDLSSGFLIDEDGNYYKVKEKFFPEDLSMEEIDFLFYSDNLKTFYKYDLIYKSSKLAENLTKILSKYSDEIQELPENIAQHGICDGRIEYLQFYNKKITGVNALNYDHKPYHKINKRPDYLSELFSTEEEFEQNEENLYNLNNIYLEIIDLLNKDRLLQIKRNYIPYVRWQYAKTYITAPHEYTVLDWDPNTQEQMIDFAKLIRETGIDEIFGNSNFKVLVIDDMKYWTMDSYVEDTDLINRTYVDDSKRKLIIDFVQSGKFNFIKGMSLSDITKQIESRATSYILPEGNLPQDFPKPSEKELEDFRSYISNFKWKSAKTFEKFSPHQYILNFPCWKMKEDGKCNGENEACTDCKKQREEFEKWVLFIRKYGERCQMQKTIYTVLCVDGRQYWTMGDPLETTWVLNRALINEPRRIPKLEWLDRQ